MKRTSRSMVPTAGPAHHATTAAIRHDASAKQRPSGPPRPGGARRRVGPWRAQLASTPGRATPYRSGATQDSLGNLSEALEPTVIVDYVVDAFNRRILKKRNGAASAQYLYGGGSRIAAVLDGSGNLAARFVYASHPSTPDFMVLADGTVFKFLCDQLGSPRVIVNAATGVIVETIAYDPWGKASVLNYGAFAQWQQPFGFAGGLYDEDTGLVRFGARDYDAEVGRWLAKDPILLGGGQTNLYVYAGDDPVNRIDPSGLWDGFVWHSLEVPIVESPAAGIGAEGIGIVGYDSGTGAYGALVGAGAVHAGSPAVNGEVVRGREIQTPIPYLGKGPTTINGITLMGLTGGEGIQLTAGLYRTDDGKWGFYGGGGPGFAGAHSFYGAGFGFGSYSSLFEKIWTGAVCP
jgi:RHS repeat-associated protein